MYGSLKGGWRVAAHARAATALAQRGAPAVVCAPHVEHSAHIGDEQAIDLLVEAGRMSVGRAPASAARWLEAALRLVPERGPASERRAELLPELASALASVGLIERSHDALMQALERLPESASEERFELIALCAGHEITLGHYEDAHGRLVAALRDAGNQLSRGGVLVELELAGYGTYVNDFELSTNHAARAIDKARALGERTLQAHGGAVLGMSRYVAGQIAEAQEAHSEASRLVAELDDDAASRRLDTFWILGWLGWFLGRFADGERHFRRGVDVSRASRRAHLLTEMTVGQAIALTWLGRISEAIALSEDALEAAWLTNNPNTRMWSSIARCLALTAAGDMDGAVRSGEQSLHYAGLIDVSVITAGAAWTSAAALIEAGDSRRAVELILEMLGGPELPAYFVAMRPLCYGLLARGAVGDGDVIGARGWAARASGSAAHLGSPLAGALADLAGAEVCAAEGDAARAAELALGSAALFDQMEARLDACRARLVAGRALASIGDREQAGDVLRAAEEVLAACGAQRLRAEAVRELRAIGRRVKRAGRRGQVGGDLVGSLSGREREVADLVQARKTNREIAAELFLSEKTVESHLSSVFVKLGVSSRVEVARAIEQAADGAC